MLAVVVIAFVLFQYVLPSMLVTEYVEKGLENIEPAGEGDCTSAKFLIYSCAYSESGKTLNLVLQNTGGIELNSLRAFLTFQDGSTSNPMSLDGALNTETLKAFKIEGVENRVSSVSVFTHCPGIVEEKVCSAAA
ncbi:MAG: hypothetical protein ABIA12_02760 [Candidatus Aenigmatarchaeota archaeon]